MSWIQIKTRKLTWPRTHPQNLVSSIGKDNVHPEKTKTMKSPSDQCPQTSSVVLDKDYFPSILKSRVQFGRPSLSYSMVPLRRDSTSSLRFNLRDLIRTSLTHMRRRRIYWLILPLEIPLKAKGTLQAIQFFSWLWGEECLYIYWYTFV